MLAVALILALLLILCYIQRKPKRFPPGPPRLPIVGSLPFLSKFKTQYFMFNDLPEIYGRICGFYLGSKPTIILSDLDLIKQVYKMEEAALRPRSPFNIVRYSNLDGDGTKGILFSSGPEWKEQRRFALKNLKDFGFGKASMEDTIQQEASKLCSSLKLELNVPTQLDAKLNISIVNALWIILVGDELELENPVHQRAINILNNLVRKGAGGPNRPIVQTFPFLAKMFPGYFTKQLRAVMESVQSVTDPYRKEHRDNLDQSNPRDFLDVHIQAQLTAAPGSSFHGVQGQQHEEVNLLDLFIAGTETTSTTITWGILYLLHHPEVQERIQEELDSVVGNNRLPSLQDEPNLPYLAATILEIQRSASIVYVGVPHSTDVDIEVDGYTIPRGSTIFANILKVMHNPEVFEEPELFKPERFLDGEGKVKTNPHVIPFLVGKRICLGMTLAEKELFLFFSQLLQTFSFHPVPGDKVPDYSTKARDVETPNGIIRFCPQYRIIIKERCQ